MESNFDPTKLVFDLQDRDQGEIKIQNNYRFPISEWDIEFQYEITALAEDGKSEIIFDSFNTKVLLMEK